MIGLALNDSPHVSLLLGSMGAIRSRSNSWILITQLQHEELPSVWLAIATDLFIAGVINSVCAVPVIKTTFGLYVYKLNLSITAKDVSLALDCQLEPPVQLPCVILAGLPCSGKSTVANELRKVMRIASSVTEITRSKRSIDIDFDQQRYVNNRGGQDLEARRGAGFAIPVVFQQERYYSSVAEKLVRRFDPKYDMVMWIDSHELRVRWVKKLMPDAVIVWLDAKIETLSLRCRQRKTEFPDLSPLYLSGCEVTKQTADLALATDEISPSEIAREIIRFVHRP